MDGPLRMLVIDDNPDDRLLTTRVLRREFPDVEVKEIADEPGFARALDAGEFDVVVTDYRLGWGEGIGVLRAIKEFYPDCPVVMFTSTGDQETAVEAMKSGLDDYVVKAPRHFARLPVAVRGALERADTRRRASEAEERFRLMAEGARDFAFIMLDLEGRVTEWTGGAETTFGYRPEEIIGRHGSIIFTPEDRQVGLPERELEQAAREGRAEDDKWAVGKGGGRIWLSGATVALRNGGLRGFAKIVRDQTELKIYERRLTIQYQVSRVLAEATRLEDAAPRVLSVIGEGTGWDYGAVWVVDSNVDALHCAYTWRLSGSEPTEFESTSRRIIFRRGEGLPGTIWASGEPRWVADTASESNFPRLGIALSEGLRSGFGLPVILGGRVIAVVEFLSRELREPDSAILEMTTALGRQIGQFIERARVEESVRESEALKAGILESALDAIVTMDREGKIVEFNPAAEAMFGYDRAEAIGREMAELIIPPSLRDQHRRGFARYLATGEGRLLDQRYELVGMRADGSEFPVELIITRIRPDGPPLFTGFVRDITERKRAEKERERLLAHEQASRRRVVDILESISNAFYAVDREWRFTYINREAERLWGRSREALLGRNIWEEFPQSVGSESYEQILRAAREGITTEFETVSPVLGVWIAGRVYPSPDGVSVYFQDITQRRRMEEALRARVGQQAAIAELGRRALAIPNLRTLMDTVVDVISGTLSVEYCKVLELLPGGKELRLVAGIGWSEGLVGHATVPTALDSQAGYTLLSDGPVIVEDLATERRFSGPAILREHGVASGISAIIGGQDDPFGVLGAHTRERREFTRDDANFLQAVANILATAIRRKRFEDRLAAERAEAARIGELDRLRSEFVSSISHDLKTPLTAVGSGLGMLQMSAGDRLRADELLLLDNARRNADRLRRLIDDLLAFNQLEAGKMQIEPVLLDLRGVVADAVGAVHPLLESKGQELAADLPEPLLARGDAFRMGQVLINLLSNAHYHTPIGTYIRVAAETRADELVLTVSDDGPGLPIEELRTIFERSRRLDPAAGGAGLGLAIARGIVELHGGRIWAESRPGQGATFRLAIPRAEGDGRGAATNAKRP